MTLNYTVQIYTSNSVDIPVSFAMDSSLIQTVYITTNVDVAVYTSQKLLLSSFNTFLALPLEALGKNYRVPQLNSMVIMATSTRTSVHINYTNGDVQEFLLDAFQAHSLLPSENHDRYSIVSSNATVSIFVGLHCETSTPCLFSTLHLIPHDQWNFMYIAQSSVFDCMLLKFPFCQLPDFCCNICKRNIISSNAPAEKFRLVSTISYSIWPEHVHFIEKSKQNVISLPGIFHYLPDYKFSIPANNSTWVDYLIITVLNSRRKYLRFDERSLDSFSRRSVWSLGVRGPLLQFHALRVEVDPGFHRV